MPTASTISVADLLRFYAEAGVDVALEDEAVDRFAAAARPISPLAGEMSGRTEGGATERPPSPHSSGLGREGLRPTAPPSALPGARGRAPGLDPSFGPPARGEIGQPPPSALSGVSPTVPDQSQVIAARGLAQGATSLAELKERLAAFEGCNLRFTAKNLVFADGNPDGGIMFVGEAPGRDEDLAGLPFVGRSGQLLDRMLAAIGLDRGSAYIANVIPWRPPGNRTPTPHETEICRPFIERQIELARPKLIVTLGGPSSKVLLETTEGILRLRGNWRVHRTPGGLEIPAMPTLHPAYLLRNPAHKRLAWRDFLQVKARLREMGSA